MKGEVLADGIFSIIFSLGIISSHLPSALNFTLQVDGCHHCLFGGRHHEIYCLFTNPHDEI